MHQITCTFCRNYPMVAPRNLSFVPGLKIGSQTSPPSNKKSWLPVRRCVASFLHAPWCYFYIVHSTATSTRFVVPSNPTSSNFVSDRRRLSIFDIVRPLEAPFRRNCYWFIDLVLSFGSVTS